MSPKVAAAAALVCMSWYGCTPAHAQGVPQVSTSMSDFATEADFADLPNNDRGRNQSVSQRHVPGYDALGVDLPASIRLFPKLSGGVGYTDNLYRTDSDTTGASFLTLQPAVNLTSDWLRNAVWADASADLRRYPDHASDNENRWRVNAGGRFDFSPELFVEGGASFVDSYEDRGGTASSLLAAGPVEYSLPQAYFKAVAAESRSRFSLTGQVAKFDYQDVGSVDGGVIDQHYRDERLVRLQGKAEYGLVPEAAVFGEVTYTKSDFTEDEAITQGRNSNDVRILAGANFDLTDLIRGELGAGYVRRHFESPALQPAQGVAALASIEYFLTRLTSVTLRLRRSIEDSTIAFPTSLFANSADLRVDHELLRNLVLGAQLSYRLEQFVGTQRDDRVFLAAASARYLVSSSLNFDLGVSEVKRTTTDPQIAAQYRSAEVFLRATLQR